MKAPIPESEERLIVEYIYLTYLIKALEFDQKAVNRMNFKIPEVYQHLIENKIDFLWKKVVKVKKEMKELKIRVEDPRGKCGIHGISLFCAWV